MRFHTYSKFSPESADAVDLQSLLDNLADFLLQSGFAGGGPSNPWGYEDDDQGGDRSMDALREAILQALMDSGQLTPEMMQFLRGESSGDAEQDALYDEAVRIVTESRKASISGVQRRLKIGYNRAARMIEAMEAAGLVGPLNTNGSREVLAPPPPEVD